ncbi:MAG: dienelactone hydrolase family protein [Caulobacteraceae bacterium]
MAAGRGRQAARPGARPLWRAGQGHPADGRAGHARRPEGRGQGGRADHLSGAGHGFHADYRDSYNEAAAKDGWSRLLAWFAAHGAAPGKA